MGNKIELPPVSKRPNGHIVEAEGTEVNAAFVWDKKSLTWQMTDCQRTSDNQDSVDPMEKVIWYKNNDASKQPDTKEEVNIIPQLVEGVREQRGRRGVWIYPDTQLDTLVSLEPGYRAVIPDIYQQRRNEGATLVITVGGITEIPAPKK